VPFSALARFRRPSFLSPSTANSRPPFLFFPERQHTCKLLFFRFVHHSPSLASYSSAPEGRAEVFFFRASSVFLETRPLSADARRFFSCFLPLLPPFSAPSGEPFFFCVYCGICAFFFSFLTNGILFSLFCSEPSVSSPLLLICVTILFFSFF